MKYYSTFAVFKNNWDQVACAYWQKYPNPYSKHVLTEDLISRSVIGKKLFSTRLLTKTNRMPKWGYTIFGNNAHHVCIVEESVLDPEKKSMTTYTRNIGYQKFMVVIEKCTYTPSEDNKNWTECKKEAWIDSTLTGVSSILRKLGYERFKNNAHKSFRGLQYIIDRLYVPETLSETKVPSPQVAIEKLSDVRKEGVAATKATVQGMAAKAKSHTVAQ